MEGIDRVRNTKVCGKESIDLSLVCQICFDQESLNVIGCFGLDQVGENKLHVWRSRVVP